MLMLMLMLMLVDLLRGLLSVRAQAQVLGCTSDFMFDCTSDFMFGSTSDLMFGYTSDLMFGCTSDFMFGSTFSLDEHLVLGLQLLRKNCFTVARSSLGRDPVPRDTQLFVNEVELQRCVHHVMLAMNRARRTVHCTHRATHAREHDNNAEAGLVCKS